MAYITTLTPEQTRWCSEQGVTFRYSPRYKISSFSKGPFHIDMIRLDAERDETLVVREPSVTLDGPDCNDGEPVTVARCPNLRAALAELVRVAS